MKNNYQIEEKYASNFAYFYAQLNNLKLVTCANLSEVAYYNNNFLYENNAVLLCEEKCSFLESKNVVIFPSDKDSLSEYLFLVKGYLFKQIRISGTFLPMSKIDNFISYIKKTDERFHLTFIGLFISNCEYEKSMEDEKSNHKTFLQSIVLEDKEDWYYKLFNICLRSPNMRRAYLNHLVSIDLHKGQLFEKFLLSYFRTGK